MFGCEKTIERRWPLVLIKVRHILGASFRDLEIMLSQELAGQYRVVFEEVLGILDGLMCADRNSERFELKDRRPRSLETLFGALGFKRRYCRDRQAGAYVALLDEALGLAKQARLSPGLTEAAVWQGVDGPFCRAAHRTAEAFYHRPVVSPGTVRQKVIETGRLIIREQQWRQREVQWAAKRLGDSTTSSTV